MRVSNLKIGQILINEGDITEEQLQSVLAKQKEDANKGKRIADLLIEEKYVTEQQVCKALEKQLLIPYVDLDELKLPEDVGSLIPEEMATNNQVVPIEKEGRFLTVAIADPLNYQGLKDISIATKMKVKAVIAEKSKIDAKLRELYAAQKALDDAKEFLESKGSTKTQAQIEAEEAANAYGEALLKSPWSSSGRGLTKTDNPQWKAWAKRILKAQGSIVVERFLHKVSDFALEFWLDGKGGVEYQGLSLFYTNERGAYLGNWVAPEEQKLAWLAQYIPLQYLQEIRAWWTARLSRFDYAGPVGIDMMLAQEGICPCIEVNWRWTMGLVSCLVAEQGRYGRMVVEYIYGHYSAEVEAFS